MKLLSLSTLIVITALSFNLDNSTADSSIPPSGCAKTWKIEEGINPSTGMPASICIQGGAQKCFQTHNEQKKNGCVTDEMEDALRLG